MSGLAEIYPESIEKPDVARGARQNVKIRKTRKFLITKEPNFLKDWDIFS